MIVQGTGPRTAAVMVVGEQPGEWEAKTGIPFHPKAAVGRELRRQLREVMRLDPDDVFMTNLVREYQKGHEITKADIHKWEGALKVELKEVDPRLIIALGREATRWFLGDVNLEDVYALPHSWKNGSVVVPNYLRLYDSDLQPQIWYGFEQARRILHGEITPHVRCVDNSDSFIYASATAPPDVRWIDGAELVAIDTEGLVGQPWGLSFSNSSKRAHVIRVEHRDALVAFKDAIRNSRIILHNSLHDLGVLRDMDINVTNFDDTMVMAFLLGLEPQGLKALAYRYRGIDRQSYEEVIRPAADRIATVWLELAAMTNWGPAPEELIFEEDRVRISRPYSINQRIDKILGGYVGEIMVTRKRKKKEMAGFKKQLEELGVRVGKYNLQHSGWVDCRFGQLVWEKLAKTWGVDFIWWANRMPPAAHPRECWKVVSEDMPETADRIEQEIGPMREADLYSVEAVYGPAGKEIITKYSAGDADDTWTIYPILKKQIDEMELTKAYELDLAVIPMIDRMMHIGFKADGEYFFKLGKELTLEMQDVLADIERAVGYRINPNSSKQVAALLFKKLKLPIQGRTPTGEPSTADDVIEGLRLVEDHPVLPMISDYRELAKMYGTYANKLPRWLGKDGRIHPKLRITRVPSGRLACSEPNLMAIPVRSQRMLGGEKLGVRIRNGFVAKEGCVLGSWDLDQIEMRVLADCSGDENLIGIFHNGEDIHKKTASLVFGVPMDQVQDWQRTSAKSVGFGIVYGQTAGGLRLQMKLRGIEKTEAECQAMIDAYLEDAYPKVKSLMEEKKAEARRYGYVRSMFGRLRHLPHVRSENLRLRSESERISLNHTIQTTAQEILKLAMDRIWHFVLPAVVAQGWYCEPILQIHDEIVLEVEEGIAAEVDILIKAEMENAIRLKVPLGAKGHYAKTWGKLK